MAIPDYQTIMLPLLQCLADGAKHSVRNCTSTLADSFKLTVDEQNELLPSGKQPIFTNRVGWAKTYLKKAGLVDSPERAVIEISPTGKKVLDNNPPHINIKFLEKFDDFKKFRVKRTSSLGITTATLPTTTATPEETLEAAYQTLRDDLSEEILTTVKQCSPAFFEKLVVDLVVSMGYGGSHREAGRAVGGSGDSGIDGIINEDRLGLDSIYLQAKRWDGSVSRPEIQKFAGALQGQRARKGIFITTSTFTKEAQDYVSRIDSKIVLIDGQRLANLMIDHKVGVTLEASYEVKRMDSDYFSEI